MLEIVESGDSPAPQASAALIVIGFNAGRSIDFLSGAMRLTHSGCVRPVDKLENAGLVERHEGSDLRVAQLYFAPAGRWRMQRGLRARRNYLEELL